MSRSSASSSRHARSAPASQAGEVLRAHCAAIAKEEAALREGGGKAGHERQRKMNRLPVRERLSLLLDKDSPFFEIGLWAAYKMYEQWGKIPAAGVVAGIGNVEGVPCMIIANDATVKAGAFKNEIQPMDRASEAILALKPITFQYKGDKTSTPQFGLIAEEVAQVNPDLVARDENGEIYTVRYDAVNAMLLNEFLKEHRKVEQLEKEVEALTGGLQKVSAQLELSKSAPQAGLNSQ
jgi:hypothetical protein